VTARSSRTIALVAPWFAAVGLAVAGYVLAVSPLAAEYRRDLDEATRLEVRGVVLREAIARDGSVAPADPSASVLRFERRVSESDVVAELAERLARLADESARETGIRSVRLSTGDAGAGAPAADVRFALFPSRVTATPVTVSFEASYATMARLAWRLRELPTVVDIESIRLTRGKPFMHADVRLLVCRRGDAPPVRAGRGRP
jgi:hypothetical protein